MAAQKTVGCQGSYARYLIQCVVVLLSAGLDCPYGDGWYPGKKVWTSGLQENKLLARLVWRNAAVSSLPKPKLRVINNKGKNAEHNLEEKKKEVGK